MSRQLSPHLVGSPAPAGQMQVHVHDGDEPVPAQLARLIRACTAADDHPPFGEHTLLTLDGHRQVWHTRMACWRGTDLAGYAVLAEGLDAWYLELAVHPHHRGRGTGTALVGAATEHVASHGGGTLRAWAHHAGPAAERLASGWEVTRALDVLQRPLDAGQNEPAVPPGVRLHSLDTSSPADRDAWLELSNAAFAGHPENGSWTRNDLDWRMDAVWTDPTFFPVLHDEVGVVAGVWTKADPVAQGSGSGAAELYVVAVHPRWQGRGLGAVVVAEALTRLARARYDRAVLYVDSDNHRAGRLYARHGFTVHHQDRCYDLTVPAATATAPGTTATAPGTTTPAR